MSSFHLEFTPEQREKFVCTDITNEFEIRVRQSHSYYDKSVKEYKQEYKNGTSKENFDSVVSMLLQDPSYKHTTEIYTNKNFTDDIDHRTSYRERDSKYILKSNIFTTDIKYIGFELRISESKEENVTFTKEKKDKLFLSFEREIVREKFEKVVSPLVTIYVDCSLVINKSKNKRKDAEKTWEIEVEVKCGNPNLNFYSEIIPYLEQIVLALYTTPLPPYKIECVQRSTVYSILSDVENDMKMKLDKNVRSLAVNIKEKHIPFLNQYALTNKLDGERKMIYVCPNYLLLLNSAGIREDNMTDSCFVIKHGQSVPTMLLDVEYENKEFYGFDLVFYKNKGVMITPSSVVSHQQRMEYIIERDIPILPFHKKKFYYGTFSENMSALIKDNPDANLFFKQNDGLIFTPKDVAYIKTHEEKQHLKFKFSSKLSVDFSIRESIQTATSTNPFYFYELYTANNIAYKSDMRLPNDVLASLVPISPNTVVECIRVNKKWVMLRNRPDRDTGNRMDVIKDIQTDMDRPISLTHLYRGVVPEELASYVSVLDDNNNSYLYDIFFDKLLSLSYIVLPEFTTIIMHFFSIKNVESNVNILTPLITKLFFEKNKGKKFPTIDSEILELLSEIIQQQRGLVRYPLTYYNTTELDNFNSLYEYIFPNHKSKLIFDVRRFGMLTKENGYNIHHHVFAKNPITESSPKVVNEEMYQAYIEKHFTDPELKFNAKYEFYKSKSNKELYDTYKKFYTVESSGYSVLKPWNEHQVQLILSKWFPAKYKIKRIVDATSHIGIDSIHLSNQFPNSIITSFELVPDTFIALSKNIILSNKSKQIIPVFQNVTEWLPKEKIDIVYLDPPWGGPNYKYFPTLELYLQKEHEMHDGSKNVKYIIDQWMDTGLVSHFIMKVPFNFNREYLQQKYKVQEEPVYNLDNKVEWFLLHIERTPPFLYKPKSKLTIWSVPYYTSYEPIFLNTDAVLVNVLLYDNYYYLEESPLRQYMYSPISFDAPKLIEQNTLIEYAKKLRFHLKQTMDISNNNYLLFIKDVIDDTESSLEDMRKYHNNEKKYLIQTYAKKKTVLDLGAGFGGDLLKYSDAGVTKLIAVEPNQTNLLEFSTRLNSSEMKSITTMVWAAGQDWDKIKPYLDNRVEIVSSFFSMTFLFESITILRGFLHTVYHSLQECGYFIGTMMSGEKTYKLVEGIRSNETISFGTDITIVKKYENSDPSAGMKINIKINSPTVGVQDEYLAFFSILQHECEEIGLQLITTFDFKPPEKLNQYEKQFSMLNIGFVFQKKPKQFDYETTPINVDETYQFINLYQDEQNLVRTGIEPDFSFYRSYLYNTNNSSYRNYKTNNIAGARKLIIKGFFTKYQKIQPMAQEDMKLSDIPDFMSKEDINIYIIDSITRRPIYMDGYNVARKKSIMIVYHQAKNQYEPLAINTNDTAKYVFSPLDYSIAMVHRSMKKQKFQK